MPAHGENLDDQYHEYLWGEASPRAFARRAKVNGAKGRYSVKLEVEVGVDADLAGVASR